MGKGGTTRGRYVSGALKEKDILIFSAAVSEREKGEREAKLSLFGEDQGSRRGAQRRRSERIQIALPWQTSSTAATSESSWPMAPVIS